MTTQTGISLRVVTLRLLAFNVFLLVFADGSELYTELMLLDAIVLFVNKAVCFRQVRNLSRRFRIKAHINCD